MSGRARCARCGARRRGDAAFCAACGARQVAGTGGATGATDGDEQAVELDLTPDGRAVPVGDEVVFERADGRRGRAIGGGVAVAIAVAIGASVLSGGGSGDTAATTTTGAATTTTVAATTSTTEASPPTEPTTTTLPPPFAAGPPDMFGEPTGLRLAVIMSSDLVVVDADSGRAEVVAADVLRNDGSGVGQPSSIGLITNLLNSGLPGLLRPGATKAEALVPLENPAVAQGANYLGEGPPGRLWVMLYNDNRPIVGFVEPDAGTPFTEVGSPPQFGVMKADGLGGVVFFAPGGVYRWVPGGAPARVAEGYLLDAANGHVVTAECDPSLVCTLQVLHLADGTSWRTGPVSQSLATFGSPPSVAPDGRHVLVNASNLNDGQFRLTIYGDDGSATTFTTESFSACGPFGCPGPGLWASDGSWLVGVKGSDELWAWRPGLDAPVTSKLPAEQRSSAMTFNTIVYVGAAGDAGGPLGVLRPPA